MYVGITFCIVWFSSGTARDWKCLMANPKAQAFRQKNASKFKQIGEGVFGGYKKGVPNGPEPRRPARNQKAAKTAD